MKGLLHQGPSPLTRGRGVDVDFPLLAACLGLLGLGLVMTGSASSEVAAANTGSSLHYLWRHLIYLLLGGGVGFVSLGVSMDTWHRFSGKLLLGAVILLVLVLVPGIGREINGSSRWIGLGAFNIQPSELAKLFGVLFLASYLVRRQPEVRETWMGFFKPFIVLVPIAGLLLEEPDFGATVVLVGAAMAMLFLGGGRLSIFTLSLVIAVAGVCVLVLFKEYRMQRLIAFINPWADQFGSGYQLTQALIAFGRGDWFGVGLGHSVQKQFYLPEAHTDFVFSVLAEELGMLGALLTLGLFAFVAIRALYIGLWAEQVGQYFNAYVAWGIAFLWSGQFLINIGVNIGLLPTKGLTLPFLSYGGSSLLVTCVSMAMLLRIEWESRMALLGAKAQPAPDALKEQE